DQDTDAASDRVQEKPMPVKESRKKASMGGLTASDEPGQSSNTQIYSKQEALTRLRL
ncbi:MAG: hypothetical protein EZS28_044949, partial [Streblomastix strix]